MPEASPAVGADPLEPLVRFGRMLRARGLPVGTGRILTFCRAAAVLQPLDRDRLYWAGRATLSGRREDADVFDDAFEEWYRSIGPPTPRIELDLPRPSDRRIGWEGPDELE